MADSSLKTLRNEDFRKLLATPGASRTAEPSAKKSLVQTSSHSFTHRQTLNSASKKPSKGKFKAPRDKGVKKDEDDIFAESQAKLNELLQKYRDRAAERRKGLVGEDDAELKSKITAAYKAMPGTASATASMAERRKMEIQESKYLGGDMEHTHLVKGLDYSLLNKVRGEMESSEDRDELEKAYEAGRREQNVEQISNNKVAKNICRLLFQSERPKSNDMFMRGRMAYVVELEAEEDSDVPCTLLRSVADCPAEQNAETMNTDSVLISKLEQVLGYLRTDLKKRKKGEPAKDDGISRQKIYDDVDDYVPSKSRDQKPTSSSNYGADRKEKSSYFEGKRNDDYRSRRGDRDGKDRGGEDYDHRSDDRYRRGDNRRDDHRGRDDYARRGRDNGAVDAVATIPKDEDVITQAKAAKRRRMEEEDDAYAELYPSGIGFLDAAGGESDEEDFSKMDLGNRKGPIKRWDFETEKEYETYQEGREAMPKAAYQYGVKMNSGRKTRKNNAMAGEKKLDRELDKINKILDERKKFGNK